MAESDLARALYGEKVITFTFPTLTNVLAAGSTFAAWIVPRNLILKGVGVAVVSSDSAAAGIEAKITNAAGTVLVSSGATTPSATTGSAQTEDGNVLLTRGQLVLIKGFSVADTNDFVGCTINVICEAPKTDS